jgi:monofunctional biosynthetic peptidoglycan transglycosylase
MSVGRLLRRVVGLAIGLVLAYVAAVVLLGLAYTAATPVSTLMLARVATGQSYARQPVPLEAISPYLAQAVIASEDARFCQHGGVDWVALREVIEEADEDGPTRGASTISMQTAKNLFLWPGRSVVRKGMEIPVALYADFVWSKRRMMENYLNMAEWGEGIFGAEAAAQHHFRKPARALTRTEAALLATALPNPVRRNAGRPNARHRALAARLLGRMAGGDLTSCLKA